MKRFFCVLFLMCTVAVFAQTNFVLIGSSTNSVKLGWCPSPSANVAFYNVAYGTGDVPGWSANVYDTNSAPCPRILLQAGSNWFRAYTTNLNVGNVTSCTIVGLLSGVKYYFAVIAESSFGDQAPPSNEIMYYIAPPVRPFSPRNLRLQ